jgi:FKBP-type peptidyl-prolyl cis-trans isomerase
MRTVLRCSRSGSIPASFLQVAGAVVALTLATGCSKRVEEPPQSEFKPAEAPPLPPGPEKLEIVDDVVGTGPEAKKGDTVKVHYTGTLLNGKQFDSSRGKEPFQVTIGQGQVIKGWDEGLPGMKVGGKRTLTIPWQMAYGEKGSGATIPPKAALKFEVELMEIVGATDAGADAGKAGTKPAAAGAAGKDAGAKK